MNVSYVFYRYSVVSPNGANDVDFTELLYGLTGVGAPYRVKKPEPEDLINFVIDPDTEIIEGEECGTCIVGHKITSRPKFEYDEDANKVLHNIVPADDLKHSNCIFWLHKKVAAVRDGSGDRLSADSAMARLQKIISYLAKGYVFDYERTASPDDIKRALKRLSVIEFKFDARPFNPHPSTPGDKLDELLKKAGVQKLTGVAKPKPGKALKTSGDGLLSEVSGLANKNYASFGLTAETAEGSRVVYPKEPLTGDKQKDRVKSEQTRNLRVSVPTDDENRSEQEYVVAVMKELFSDEDR